ncbi:MAG: hypothetical protein M0022_09140 [Desulfobacteraceae bacterium]|nr:hypothetical protein [Desulfobacteraceae bacterium]
MERKEALEMLVSMLKEIQKERGEEGEEIHEKTRPIGGLRGFDSLTSVILTAQCFEKFKIKDNVNVESLCIGKNEKGYPCTLTVGEITDRILILIKG